MQILPTVAHLVSQFSEVDEKVQLSPVPPHDASGSVATATGSVSASARRAMAKLIAKRAVVAMWLVCAARGQGGCKTGGVEKNLLV